MKSTLLALGCLLLLCTGLSAQKNNAAADYKIPSDDPCGSRRPKTVRDLSGGVKKLYYQLTAEHAASLKLFGVGASLSKKETMIIVDFVQFKDMTCGNEKVRYGVGARLFLHVKRANKDVKVTELPYLAASVQLGNASVTYSIETIGVTGDKINDLLPGTGDFNVEAYSKIFRAIDEIQLLTRDGVQGVVIDPQIIPVAE